VRITNSMFADVLAIGVPRVMPAFESEHSARRLISCVQMGWTQELPVAVNVWSSWTRKFYLTQIEPVKLQRCVRCICR
jgi:hypothetical protein